MVSLAVAVLGLLAIANAWRRQLIPWETEWGNWAEWAGAVATALGFVFAVFTLSRNGKAEAKRRVEFQELEASRVVVTVNYAPTKSANFSRVYDVDIHNAASSPVKQAMFHMDMDALHFTPLEDQPALPPSLIEFGTVPAGGIVKREVRFVGYFGRDFETQLKRTICFWFYDVNDALWLHENGLLKRVPSGQQYVEALANKAELKGSDIRK